MDSSSTQKLSLGPLIALVVGSMIGAGVFSLPATFARATGVAGALIAWTIAGGGMLMLAFVFQTLAERKPDLDSGMYAYAHAGFGNYVGFIAALGFWTSICVGNVSYFVLIKSTLGAFFPVFGDGNTLSAIIVSSLILWSFHFLILRGVKQAAAINAVVTVAKIVPIFIFLGVAFFAFKSDIFTSNLFGYDALAQSAPDLAQPEQYGYLGHAAQILETAPRESLFSQVRSTMLLTVFVFIGIEGASVYSRYAKRRKDVGLATVLGFVGVLLTFVMVTMLSYGVLTRAELAGLRQPSMAGVLASIVGPWGLKFVSAGLIVSVLGAYLAWSLLAAEALFTAAQTRIFPSFLTRENAAKAPVAALWVTNILIQSFLIATYFSAQAFVLALELSSALSLIPYLLVAGYALKLAWTGESYELDASPRKKELIVALVATFYSLMMIYSGGLKYILLSALIYAPASFFYLQARREQKLKFFTAAEALLFLVLVSAAAFAAYGLFSGLITI